MRLHTKFLTSDYLTSKTKFEQSGKGNPLCKICKIEDESLSHIIATCTGYSGIRQRTVQQTSQLCLSSENYLNFQDISSCPDTLSQFLLDPSSFNLKQRVNVNDPVLAPLFKLSRDLCYSIHRERIRKLQSSGE